MYTKAKGIKRFFAAVVAAALAFSMMATAAFAADGSPKILSVSLPDGTKDVPYAVNIESSGTVTSWSATGLPAGLTIGGNGIISGTPTESGEFSISVTAENGVGTDNKSFLLNILASAVAPIINTDSIPSCNLDEEYRFGMTAVGSSITWSATSLPDGLNINNASGMISGTASRAGSYTVTITATNPVASVSKTYTMLVRSAPEITTLNLPNGTEGVAYSHTMEVSGTGTYEWTATGLPNGLSINRSTGAISGIPNATGTFSVTVTASGSAGENSKMYPLTINAAEVAPTITTESLPGGVVGKDYKATVKANGSDTILWSAAGLPAGLNISGSTGVIAGTPSAAGTFKVTLTATNNEGSSSATLNLVINADETTYTVTGSIDNGGTIKGANPQNVAGGEDSEAITFIAADGYRISKVTINDREYPDARNSTKYTFDSVEAIAKNYTIVVKTERIPSDAKGLGIDNTTANNADNMTATNAGGTVKVGNRSNADYVDFVAGQNTVAFIPASGWNHASTFGVTVTDSTGTARKFTMTTPVSSTNSLRVASGSAGTQAEWDRLFPDASATVRSSTITLKLANDADDMPYQVLVNVRFIPTLVAKSASVGGSTSVSGLNIYAEAESRYKVSKIALSDPATGKNLTITSLPSRENSKGEYYDRSDGNFAGILTTRIDGETAKVWVSGNIDITKSGGYITEMDVSLDNLPISLEAAATFIKRSASDTDNDDDDDYIEDGTGNLVIKNVVRDGSRNKAFTFYLSFPNDADEEYEITGDVDGYVEDGDSITLYAGEKATIHGLPVGTKYRIEQDDPGSKYETSYDVSTADEGDGLDTGRFRLRDGKTTTVTFTNAYKDTTTTPTVSTNGGSGNQKDNPHTGR